MADKRITGLSAITSVGATDVLHIGQSAADKKITWPNFTSSVLGAHVIGGTAAGDITTNNGTQTLTGKTLNAPTITNSVQTTGTYNSPTIVSPIINAGSVLTVNSTQINNVAATTTTTTQLNYCNTLTSNVQTNLDAKVRRYSPVQIYPISYAAEYKASAGGQISFGYADILSSIGLSGTSFRIAADSYMIQLYNASINGRYQLVADAVIRIHYTEDASNLNISTVDITNLIGDKQYRVHSSFLINTYTPA